MKLPREEIASLIGYSEINALSRACKKWTGMTMTEYKKKVYLSQEDSHLFQVVSNNKFILVGVQSPTEINAVRGCPVIL